MDDEKNVLTTIQAILQEDGFEVDIANDGKPAIEAIHARHYDLVLTDLKMPEVTAWRYWPKQGSRPPTR